MTKYGYFRIFDIEDDKKSANIKAELVGNGVATNKIYRDICPKKVSNANNFKVLLSKLKQGDELYCPSLSLLAVDVIDLLNIIKILNNKDIRLIAYKDSFDSNVIFGDLLVYILQILENFSIECSKIEGKGKDSIQDEENRDKQEIILNRLNKLTEITEKILQTVGDKAQKDDKLQVLNDSTENKIIGDTKQVRENNISIDSETKQGEQERNIKGSDKEIEKNEKIEDKEEKEDIDEYEDVQDMEEVDEKEIIDENAVEEAIRKDLRKLAEEEEKTFEINTYKEKIREGYQEQEEQNEFRTTNKDKINCEDIFENSLDIKHRKPANMFNETDVPNIWNKQLSSNANLKASIDDISRLALGEGSAIILHTEEEAEASARIARERISKSKLKDRIPEGYIVATKKVREKDEGKVVKEVKEEKSEEKERVQEENIKQLTVKIKGVEYPIDAECSKYVKIIEKAEGTTEIERNALLLYLITNINSETLYGLGKGISKGRFYKLLDGLGIPRRGKIRIKKKD